MAGQWCKELWRDESGVGVVEMILIFKNQLKTLVDGIFKEIQTKTSTIYS